MVVKSPCDIISVVPNLLRCARVDGNAVSSMEMLTF